MNTASKQKIRKILFIAGFAVFFAGVIFGVTKINKPQEQNLTESADSVPTLTTPVNQSFEFEVPDSGSKPLKLKYTITEARIVKYIYKNGEQVEIPADSSVLILAIELTNDSKYAFKVNSQNFMRLVDAAGKKYAADFYNGEIDVAPISVKKDELAYIVKSAQKQFNLQVGEIDKDKQDILVNF